MSNISRVADAGILLFMLLSILGWKARAAGRQRESLGTGHRVGTAATITEARPSGTALVRLLVSSQDDLVFLWLVFFCF